MKYRYSIAKVSDDPKILQTVLDEVGNKGGTVCFVERIQTPDPKLHPSELYLWVQYPAQESFSASSVQTNLEKVEGGFLVVQQAGESYEEYREKIDRLRRIVQEKHGDRFSVESYPPVREAKTGQVRGGISEGKVCKGGVNKSPPTMPRPSPPKGQCGHQPSEKPDIEEATENLRRAAKKIKIKGDESLPPVQESKLSGPFYGGPADTEGQRDMLRQALNDTLIPLACQNLFRHVENLPVLKNAIGYAHLFVHGHWPTPEEKEKMNLDWEPHQPWPHTQTYIRPPVLPELPHLEMGADLCGGTFNPMRSTPNEKAEIITMDEKGEMIIRPVKPEDKTEAAASGFPPFSLGGHQPKKPKAEAAPPKEE